jgi:hypothetical protein
MTHFARAPLLLYRLVGLALALAIAVLPGRSRADQSEAVRSAAARTAFEEGMKQADAQAWGDAAALFQRALALRDSPVIRFNLAAALSELGRYVEASETLRGIEIDERAATDLRERARAKREGLGPKLAFITVRVEGASNVVRVMLDEHTLEPALFGVPAPLDPGGHRLRLFVDDAEEAAEQQDFTLLEGESRESVLHAPVKAASAPVALPAVVVPPPPLLVATPAPRAPEHDDRKPSRKRRALWIAGGVVAVVAAGVVTGVLMARRSSASSADAGDFDPPRVGVRVPQ